jgi:cyclophilin family peptidyl-prolyl cis-trans isomerase
VIKQFMIQGGDPNSRDTIPGNDCQGGQPYTLPAEIFPEYVHRRGAVAAARLGDQMNPKMESSGCQFYIVQGKPLTEAELAQVAANANNNYMNHFARNVYPTLPEGQWVGQLNQESLRTLPPDSIQKLNARYQQGVMDAIAARGGNFAYTDAQKQAYLSVGGTPFLDMGYTVFGEVLRGMEVVDKVTEQPTATADRPVQDIKMTVRVERLTWSELQSRYGTPTVR